METGSLNQKESNKNNKKLNLVDLEFLYPKKNETAENKILNGFSFSFSSNNIVVIIGSSGSGKTTLLNLIAGVLKPNKGSITYKENEEVKKPKVGYVFQTPSLIPWRTVKQNVLLGAEISGVVTTEIEKEADHFLAAYGLKEFANAHPSTLSGGMQQRVSIIRAVMSGANILLLDEPFSDSDFVLRRELQEDLLRIVSEQNLIAIMVTHDLIEAVKIADEIIILTNRPATIKETIKINIKREERMDTDLIMKNELYKHIEKINQILVGQHFANSITGE